MAEYNQRPHAAHSGLPPLSIFEEDADQIRFVADPTELESSFETSLERLVRSDSTCTFRGKTYEVPPHLRRHRIKLHYKLLRPDSLWIEDGGTRVPLREVDPVANFRRSRDRSPAKTESVKPRTGLNAVEDLLGRTLRPHASGNGHDDRDQEEGSSCAQS